MKVKVYQTGTITEKEIQEIYRNTVRTGYGTIYFAFVNVGKGNGGWSIVEYTTGRRLLNIGKLSNKQFVEITNFIANLNPEKIIKSIKKHEIIN